MKKLLLLAALFLAPLSVPATTTVTGHISDLSGTAQTGGTFARFNLRGCSGNQPRVNGVTLIAPTQGGVYYKDFVANASGNISGTLYSNRDSTGLLAGEIQCGTSYTGTWYGLTIYQAGKAGPETPIYAKNGATLDVTTVVPITTNPVVTAPTGDSTYLRLDAGNSPVTGPTTFSGGLTSTGTSTLTNGGSLAGNFTGNVGLLGTVTTSGIFNAVAGQNRIHLWELNNILYVDGIHFPTLASALAACPATGCMVMDAFPETFAADPFASITVPFEVHLIGGPSSATWLTNVGLRTGRNGQTIYGAGPNLTQIKASGTFPGATAVISVGAPGPSGVNGSGVFNLAVDCSSVAGSIGIHFDGVQELSGTSNTQVVNCMADGYRVSSDQGAGASQNQMVFDHIRAACSVSAAAGCVPVHVTSTAGVRVVIRDVTAVTVTPTVTTDCIKNDSTNSSIMLEDAHVEECTNGFHNTAAGGQFEVDGITGSTTTTTLVRNDSSSASYQLRNLTLNSSTNTLVDAGRTITTSAPFCSAAGISSVYITCGDTTVPWQISSDLIITPPIGVGAGIKQQLLAGFTGSTPAFIAFDNSANTQLNFTNDGRIQLRGNQTGAFVQTMASDTLTAGRAIQFPNGPSATTLVAALVTTAAATDNVTIQGMTASGHCSLTPTNAAAIGAATPPGVTTKAANQITVTHAVTANMNYDVMCTSN